MCFPDLGIQGFRARANARHPRCLRLGPDLLSAGVIFRRRFMIDMRQLLIADRYLAKLGKGYKYYSSLAKITNCWREKAQSMFLVPGLRCQIFATRDRTFPFPCRCADIDLAALILPHHSHNCIAPHAPEHLSSSALSTHAPCLQFIFNLQFNFQSWVP